MLMENGEISFTSNEQEKVMAPPHDVLSVSLKVINCLYYENEKKAVETIIKRRKQ